MKPLLLLPLVAVGTCIVNAAVQPAALFSDNMVVQREMAAPIWGWADPGEEVTVTGSWGASASTTAGAEGKWLVRLQTPEAGGPFTITIEGDNSIELKDVLSGDVWLCSGQSNMHMKVGASANAREEIMKADFPMIRTYKVGQNATRTAAEDTEGEWVVCSPETAGRFSATAYFTGRELHRELDIPIGLIDSSWGGTGIGSWTDPEFQKDDPFVQEKIAQMDNAAESYTLEQARENHEKARAHWESLPEATRPDWPPQLQVHPHKHQYYPGNLYNGMIHPLVPYGIKGVMWYQGEHNAKGIDQAQHYQTSLEQLINGWRHAWGHDFPFYMVQLPNFKAPRQTPIQNTGWVVIRESFLKFAKSFPDTAMVVTIDVGDAKDIHPKNKQAVGKRLGSTILNRTYGKQTPTCPLYDSCTTEGGKIVVSFQYTGSGLVAEGGPLQTFAIAGADGVFVDAHAEIENRDGTDVVVVSSDLVSEPASVRYAWADNPVGCNLYSKEGFPASPFRTDEWALVESDKPSR